MNASDDLFGPAYARRSDPDTSHKAAREVTPHTDTIRADVERWARGRGAEGFIDEELSAAFDATESSSYRTRRAELTVSGQIIDTKRRRPNSNMRQCIVWQHRDFAHRIPEPERPLGIRERLLRHANRLDEQADWCAKYQGRIGLAAELKETAATIREALEISRTRPTDAENGAGPHG